MHKLCVLFGLYTVLALLPLSASANYICDCYVDLRYLGQGLVFKGQAESPSLDSSEHYCKSAYRGATVGICQRDSGYNRSSTSNTTDAPQTSNGSRNRKDCIKAPEGIADACIQAFQPEYNPNPGQTETIRENCIRIAISVSVVNQCFKKFPLHSSQDEKATYLRARCIDDLSVDSNRFSFRCPM